MSVKIIIDIKTMSENILKVEVPKTDNTFNTMIGSRSVSWSQSIIQMSSKGQDHAVSGSGIDIKTKEPFTWHAIFDGHGTDSCIISIRNLTLGEPDKMTEMMETEDPVLTLANYITTSGVVSKSESSGSTMNMVRVFENRVECFNCGDSQAIVFVDGIAVHKTVKHHAFNTAERKRVTEMGCKFAVSFSITVVDEENMHGAYSERVLFPVTPDVPIPLHLVPTQALGHNSKTGYVPSKHEIPIDGSSDVKIIIGSDGVWDMRIPNPDDSVNNLFKMSAEEISQQSKARWTQLWKMTHLDEKYQPTKLLPHKMKLRDFDDVSVLVVDISSGKSLV